MAKKRDRSETEYLRGLVRSLKSQVRHLKRHNKELGVQARRFEEHEDDMLEEGAQPSESPYQLPANTCECSKGQLVKTDLGVRIITTCTTCSFRKIEKKK